MIGKARGCRFAELRDDSQAQSPRHIAAISPQLPTRHGVAIMATRAQGFVKSMLFRLVVLLLALDLASWRSALGARRLEMQICKIT